MADSPSKVAESPARGHKSHRVACPQCKQLTASRVHRAHIGEFFRSLFGIYPYYCKSCNLRFQRLRAGGRFRLDRWLHCPRCGNRSVESVPSYRVPRSGLSYCWRVLALPSYRCPECRTKFFSIRPKREETEAMAEGQNMTSRP